MYIHVYYQTITSGATNNDKRSTPKQMLNGKYWAKEGQWLYQNILAYAEFPPIVPPIVSSARVGHTRKKAGGFMHASDHNKDINRPILRPDLNDGDRKEYERIASFLGYDPLLKDQDSYMQFMNYNQFSYLELVPMAPMLVEDEKKKFPDPVPSAFTSNTDTVQWEDWPATAYKEVGHPLVTKGDSFYNHARDLFYAKNDNGQTLLDEFLEVYKNRPDKVNLCGIRINHAMALYLAVKIIQPTLVVESGVNAGVSTYFIRAASPTTRIFAIDPLAQPICGQGVRWIDDGPESKDLTINYTGDNFVDLMDLDWKEMIKKGDVDPDKTIVFIDDHLNTLKRIAGVMKHGIRHVLVEDNYKIHEGKCIVYCMLPRVVIMTCVLRHSIFGIGINCIVCVWVCVWVWVCA